MCKVIMACDLDLELQQLIEILSKALQCGNLTVHQIDLTKNVQSVLTNLLKPIVANIAGDFLPDDDDLNRTRPSPSPSILSILTPFGKFNPTKQNDSNGATSSIIPDSFNFSSSSPITISTTTTTPVPPTTGLKLHRLEIIKVVVLIFVISIILISTCRMIFQLFLRFKPSEKANH